MQLHSFLKILFGYVWLERTRSHTEASIETSPLSPKELFGTTEEDGDVLVARTRQP